MINDSPSIDIALKMKDGGATLVIMITGIEPKDKDILHRKVDFYISFIQSEDFKVQFPSADETNTVILFQYTQKPPQEIMDLEDSYRSLIETSRAKLEIKPAKYSKHYIAPPKQWWQFW